jgi:uncharacterized protein (DUF1330 family)/ADP-ribose pyrophosphatase YjhB (NUDIX family)
MIAAYQLTEFRVRDPDELAAYGRAAGRLVTEHGGRLLATSYSPPCEVVEGELQPGTVVVIHGWPEREAFRAFYSSAEYQAARRHRLSGSAEGRVLLLEATHVPFVRPVATAVVRRADSLLVWEDRNPQTGEVVCVPLAGGIEFGETGAEAIARELREEIAATVTRTDYLGAIEDIYDWGGEKRHELYLVYDVDLARRELYDADEVPVVEPDRTEYVARWRSLDEFRRDARLVPEGLLDLIDSAMS